MFCCIKYSPLKLRIKVAINKSNLFILKTSAVLQKKQISKLNNGIYLSYNLFYKFKQH